MCNPCSHRDPTGLFCFPQGDTAPDCRPCLTKLCNLVGYPAWPAGRTCNFPFPNCKRLSQEPRCLDVLLFFFALQMRADRRQPVRSSFGSFLFGPLLRLKTPRIRWFPTGTLRNWNPRPACGTAFSSVCISDHKCVFVDVSVEDGGRTRAHRLSKYIQ